MEPIKNTLQRWAGAAGVIGGIALAAAYVTHPSSAPPEVVASDMWIWIHVGFMISLLAGIFLLFALFALYLDHGGKLSGFFGFALSVISLVFVFGLDYSEVFIFPTLAVEFPEVVTRYGDGTSMPSVAFAFPVTGVIFLVGFVLFTYQLLRQAAINQMTGLVTIVGTIVFAIGLSGLFPMIVVRIGSLIFGFGLALLGISLWKESAPKRS